MKLVDYNIKQMSPFVFAYDKFFCYVFRFNTNIIMLIGQNKKFIGYS